MKTLLFNRTLLFILVHGLLLSSLSWALETEAPQIHFEQWQTYTKADGLPGGEIKAIYQMPDGYLYLATEEGLGRFNGHKFSTFTKQDGLPHPEIKSLLKDNQDNLWLGTLQGTTYYNGRAFIPQEDVLAKTTVNAMIQDRQQALWFATENGVIHHNGKQYKKYTTQDGLANNKVLCLFQDHKDQLWFGTQNGLSRFDGQQFQTFTTDHGLLHNEIRTLEQDAQGRLWIGTKEGINTYDNLIFRAITTTEGLIDNDILTLYKAPNNHLWIGTQQGVSQFDGQTFTNYTTEVGLGNNEVQAIYQDKDGYIWFGTEESLSRYSQDTFINYTEQSGLPNNQVEPIFQDQKGYLWFGTENGLSKFDGQTFQNFSTQNGLSNNEIEAIAQDLQGHLWIGTKDGLSKFDGQTFTNYTTKDGLINNEVEGVLPDANGNIWLGTEGGLSKFDGQTFTNYTTKDGLVHNEIEPLFIDQSDHLWIGTKKGLSRFDGKTFTNFTKKNGLIHGQINAIYQDKSGVIWIATEGGLCRYNGQTFTPMTTNDGLAHNEVEWITQDRQGHLWFATQGGVSKFDGHTFGTLTQKDGLINNTIVRLLEDREGHLWVATKGGITRFRPKTLSPPLVFIDAIMADRRYEGIPDLSLPSDLGLFTIEIRATSLKTRPEALQFRYRLKGHNNTWQVTNKRQITFQDLPRGNYLFEVQAIDRDLVYSEKPATLPIRVHLPYAWVGVLSILGFAALLIVLQGMRIIYQNRNLKTLHTEIAQAHSHLQSLLTHLPTGVCLLDKNQRMITANPLGKEYLNLLTDTTHQDTITHIDTHPLDTFKDPEQSAKQITIDGPPKRIFEVSGSVIEEANHNKGWVLVMKDVTRERDIEQRNQEEQHLVSIGQMAAGIAHDFNNILSTIIGYTEMSIDVQSHEPSTLQRRLKIILGQSQRAAQLIRQILDFSRKTVSQREPIDLSTLLDQTIKILKRTLPERIQIFTDLDHNEIWAEANPTQIQQVVTNLLLNANDAIVNQGEIRIAFYAQKLTSDALPEPDLCPGDWAVLSITDTGTGMAPDIIHRIYEPFFSTKPPTKGTGLGLSQVYGIVKQHGGTIIVQSEEDQGTTFTLYFPQCPKPEDMAEQETTETPTGQKETVLLAEDQDEVMQMAKDMLERLNYQVLTAKDGQEAEWVYDTHKDDIDIILSDVVMPKRGGFELYNILKEKNPALRMVLMTGYPMGEGPPNTLPAGLSGFIHKPLQLNTVAKTLNDALTIS